MSWATCYSGSNNIHLGLPALMSDARHFTNFDPNCEANNRLKKSLNIQSNYEYRQYLINNGHTLMENNTIKACDENSECVKRSNELNNTNKYLFKSISDNYTPYGYQDSNLKQLYLKKSALQNKFVSPIVTQDELLRLQSQRR